MVHVGDCVEVMAGMAAASVDAVVTDPPYGLEFMGKEWDGIGRRAGHPLDPSKEITFDHDAKATKANPWATERSGYGAPRKNPRCKICGRLKFDHPSRKCECAAPDWDTRTAEYARVMQAWHERWATEALRVLKPGGHLLAFGGTRTYHRLACALEDAGFEIRDCVCWLYGSGFPKSLDVSKAIDAAAGAEREVVGSKLGRPGMAKDGSNQRAGFDDAYGGEATGPLSSDITAPATPDAKTWHGWGTALKPAFEPIVVARKPLVGTVAANVLEHGVGALNVDGCRVDAEVGANLNGGRVSSRADGWNRPWKDDADAVAAARERGDAAVAKAEQLGRWPANVVLDEAAADLLDEQTGDLPTQVTRNGDGGMFGVAAGGTRTHPGAGESGGASRFFYCAKASRAERNAGLDGFAEREAPGSKRSTPAPGRQAALGAPRANHHPTVKPVSLMRWLVRLVTPPGGVLLDPFVGSGTTGIAANLEGARFIGCERDPDYAAIAEARIRFWQELGEDALEVVRKREAAEAAQIDGQLALAWDAE